MKVLLSLVGGAVQLQEEAGVVSLVLDDSISIGGGLAAGIVKIEGKGKVSLDGEMGLMLGEKLLNSHLPPAMLPLAQVVEGVLNQAIKAIE